MKTRFIRCFGFLLASLVAGCGSASAPGVVPQQQQSFGATTVPMSLGASAPITGTATTCADFYQCAYTISDSAGTGSAETLSAYPLNTVATYKLPGETTLTTSQQYTSNTLGVVGSTYHLNGSFTSIDANTERVVNGTTDDYIIRTAHCFRSCSYSYTLVSGTISFTLTAVDGTTTTVACTPSTFASGASTKCTATVVDLANAANVPVGNVSFSATQIGTLKPAKCTLTSGSCTVKFSPADDSVGGMFIDASYAGNKTHNASSGSIEIEVTGTN